MSYDFDGSGAANLNVATPIAAMPLTMACWFKVDTDGEGHTFICLGNAANSEIFRLGASMDIAGDPVVFRATTSGGSQANLNTTGGATIGTWHHACAVASNSTNRAVYLDGANKTAIATGTRTISAATLLAIGAQYQAGTFGADTNGKVAHVAIWDVALSDGEVAALAAGDNPLTIQPDHLIAYWPLTADLVDLVDGLTLTNGGGATLSGDNPAVDPPPGGALVPDALNVGVLLDEASVTADGALAPNDVAVAVGVGEPAITGGIVITQPVDRGRVDLARSGVVIEGGNPIVELGFLPSEDHDGSSTNVRALIMYARVQGVQGVGGLRFRAKRHPTGGHYLRANGRLLWRQTGSGWNGWQTFDNGSGGSNADKNGWNDSPFAVNDIEVVYGLPLPIGEHQGIVDGWAETAYAVEPASSVGSGTFRCGTIGGTNFADDRTGGTLDGVTLYQRVIELRDDSATPPAGRTKALLAMGTGLHASEDPFSYAHAFAVDEWLNDADLRSRFDLYLLPIMAPSGRYTGRYRGTSQIAARPGATGVPAYIEGQDLNNDWNDTVVFSEEIHNLRVAIATDNIVARIIASRGGWLDWHTDATGSNPDLFAYVGDPAEGMLGSVILPYADDYIAAADYSIVTGTGPSPSGTSRGWFEAQGVRFSTTLESGGNVANYYALAEDVGRGTMQGLADAFDAGQLGGYAITPVNVAVAVALDAATLTSISSITSANVAVAVSLDEATLASAGTVSPANLSVPVSLDAAALTVASAISPNDVAVPVAIDGANLTTGASVEPDDVSVAVSVEAATLESVSAITPGDLTVAVSLDAAEITSGASVMPADINVGVSIGSPTLAAESAVAPNDVPVVVYLSQIILNGTSAPTVTPPERRAAATGESRRAAA